MSTVEIDLDSLPADVSGYSDIVEEALASLAESNPHLRASVYVFEGPSLNFGEPGHSAFFGTAGDGRVLTTLNTAFCAVDGLKVRYSDQIIQSQATCEYHLERGTLWRPFEPGVWCSGEADDQDSAALPHGPGGETNANECSGNGGGNIRIADEQTNRPARYRAARSDATVATICRNIESVFGLPEGAVVLRGPDKRILRADATIRTLRKRWD